MSTDLVDYTEAPPIQKLNYSHQAMIDLILANPGITQNELALRFGYSASWISTVMSSDFFKAEFAKRREAIVDPALKETLKLNFEAMALRSQEILMEKLSRRTEEIPDALVLKAFELSTRAAGYGNKTQVSVEVDVNQHFDKLEMNLKNMLRRNQEPALDGELVEEPDDE